MAKPRAVSTPRAVARPRAAVRSRAVSSPAPLASARPRLALATLFGAAVLAMLDAGMLGIAIPSLRTGLHATAAGARLAVVIPLVTMAMALPVAAGIGDRVGAARLLRWSLAAFTAAAALGALAWSLAPLLVLRAIQGAASGMLLPAAVTLAVRLRPGRAWSVALFGGGLLLAPATLPVLGAWLAGGVPWRVLPLATLPLGAAALLGARLWPAPAAAEPGRRPDLAGMATAALASGTLLLALLQGAAWGWTSYAVLGLFSASVLALALLAVVELSVPDPLVDLGALGALRPRTAAVGPLLLAVAAAALGAGFLEVPLLLQGAGHLGSLQVATSLVLPLALLVAATAASSALDGRIGARWPVVAGLLLVALGTDLLHGVPPSASGRLVLLACVRATGLGAALGPLTAGVGAAAKRVGGASAAVALAVLLPTAAGAAVVSSALSVAPWSPGSQGAAGTVQQRLVLLHGDVPLPLSGPTFLATVLVFAALAAFGALLALRLPSRRRD